MAQDEMEIHVKGYEIRFIYNDGLASLLDAGKATTKRVSHVEPCEGGWSADLGLVNGPVLGPFDTRQEALDEEVKWLKENNIPAAN